MVAFKDTPKEDIAVRLYVRCKRLISFYSPSSLVLYFIVQWIAILVSFSVHALVLVRISVFALTVLVPVIPMFLLELLFESDLSRRLNQPDLFFVEGDLATASGFGSADVVLAVGEVVVSFGLVLVTGDISPATDSSDLAYSRTRLSRLSSDSSSL